VCFLNSGLTLCLLLPVHCVTGGVMLDMKNHRFSQDPKWGKYWKMHHGKSTPADIEIINTRVVGQNLSLPSFTRK
jgi:hypothetical protein